MLLSSGTRGLGSGSQTPLHVARPLREVGDVPTLPRGHARRRAGGLCRGQRRLLDADTSWQGPLGFGGLRPRQNRPDNDYGLGHQGRRLQIRYARAQLHGSRRQKGAHTIR
jgi:hypothetical protein